MRPLGGEVCLEALGVAPTEGFKEDPCGSCRPLHRAAAGTKSLDDLPRARPQQCPMRSVSSHDGARLPPPPQVVPGSSTNQPEGIDI
jgi:hypothetical protein